MRVLVVNFSLRRIGGAEIYVLSNIDALLRRGHQVTAVSADAERPDVPEQVRWIGCADFFSTSLTRFGRALRGAAVDRASTCPGTPGHRSAPPVRCVPGIRLLQRSLPTIRFVHTAWPYCPAGTRWLRSSNVPCDHDVGLRCLAVDRHEHCLVTLDGEPFGLKNSVRRLLDMRLQLMFFRSATLVAANSAYTEHEIRRFSGPDTRVVILPPPAPSTCAESRAPVPGRVLVAGRLTASKRCSRRASRSGGRRHLSSRDRRQRPVPPAVSNNSLTNSKIRERVTFLGWVDKRALDAEMQCAQVVLFPSTWPETFGQVGRAGRPELAPSRSL